jgi:phosphate/sulfate permease
MSLNFKITNMKTPYTKYIYAGFVLLAVYYTIFQKDYSSAAAQLGIALAFDPFDQDQKWNERPKWQRAWLIVHLAITAALLGFTIGLGDKV